MTSRRTIAVLPSIVALLALTSNGVVAQDESASPAAAAGPVIAVTAQDYHFEGLPSSVPAGTSLTLTNAGHEVHELLVVRKNDGVTESFDELLALPQEEALQKAHGRGHPVRSARRVGRHGDGCHRCPVADDGHHGGPGGRVPRTLHHPPGDDRDARLQRAGRTAFGCPCSVGGPARTATPPTRHEAGVHGDRRGERDRPIPSGAPAPAMPAESPAT